MHRTHSRHSILVAFAVTGVMAISGCATGSDDEDNASSNSGSATTSAHGTSRMHDAPVPAGISKAEHPKYPIGSTVTLTADHMPGMKGAHAKIVGAYDTVTYAVNYTPTNGDSPVKNHKWVVQEEIKNAPSKPLPDGAKATLTADHMPGMKGAHATIVSSTKQPVYVVDYTAHGKTIKNHKWVVQDEMKPAS